MAGEGEAAIMRKFARRAPGPDSTSENGESTVRAAGIIRPCRSTPTPATARSRRTIRASTAASSSACPRRASIAGPVCTVRLPRRENCRFFASAAAAEVDGYRPCLRCRPELAPGNASIDAGARLAQGAVDLIENGVLDDGGIEHLSARVGRDEPAPAAHLRRGVRGVADRICADAAAAAREAAAHRHGAAGHRGRARQRVRERAALQRAVQGALSDGSRAGCARRAVPRRFRRRSRSSSGSARLTTGSRCWRFSASGRSAAWRR